MVVGVVGRLAGALTGETHRYMTGALFALGVVPATLAVPATLVARVLATVSMTRLFTVDLGRRE